MATFDDIPYVIVGNILARLPSKTIAQLKGVSKHWQCLITDMWLMTPRRKIFVAHETIHLIDHNVMPHSLLKVPYPFHKWKDDCPVFLIGTCNGIVLLMYKYDWADLYSCLFVLYNPFTRMVTVLPKPPESKVCTDAGSHYLRYAHGFGYGAKSNDFKIFRIREYLDCCPPQSSCEGGACEIFSFKTGMWNRSHAINFKPFRFEILEGKFVNGFLYWIPLARHTLIVLDVEEIILSEINLPFQRSYMSTYLGTIHGCLCLLFDSSIDKSQKLDLWVMNEQAVKNSWFKRCTFTLDANPDTKGLLMPRQPICLLEDGRILMLDPKCHLVIYNTTDGSYTMTNVLLNSHDIWRSESLALEYVETLASPLDFFS